MVTCLAGPTLRPVSYPSDSNPYVLSRSRVFMVIEEAEFHEEPLGTWVDRLPMALAWSDADAAEAARPSQRHDVVPLWLDQVLVLLPKGAGLVVEQAAEDRLVISAEQRRELADAAVPFAEGAPLTLHPHAQDELASEVRAILEDYEGLGEIRMLSYELEGAPPATLLVPQFADSGEAESFSNEVENVAGGRRIDLVALDDVPASWRSAVEAVPPLS